MLSGIRPALETTFILVRHGESASNKEGRFGGRDQSLLTATGREQAQTLGLHLRSRQIDAVYCSDQMRALETAKAIGDCSELSPQPTALLQERGVGVLEGRSFDEVQKLKPDLWKLLLGKDPDRSPPGGESVREAFERVESFVQSLALNGQTITVVSHSILLHLFIHVLLGHSPEASMESYFPLSNASLSEFVLGPERTEIRYIGRLVS